ncbi:MAG: hypothetical protein K6T61_18260 [Bryobacteraceae bacterium]|nr:hypothetical protein [Bryobacteraceae bacterium]
MDWGTLGAWVGSIAGGAIGLLGGVIGTYFTVKNTNGPRERAFVINASILCWVLVALLIAGLALIPGWYKSLLVIPYVIVLVFGIRKWNETQFRIRKEESGSDA